MGTARKRFHIGDVLSARPGLVLSRRGAAGVTDLEDFMIGAHLEGLERLEYAFAVKRSLAIQYPDLAVYTDDDVPPLELIDVWLQRRAQEFAEYLPVRPLTCEEHADVRRRMGSG